MRPLLYSILGAAEHGVLLPEYLADSRNREREFVSHGTFYFSGTGGSLVYLAGIFSLRHREYRTVQVS